jgi:4-amino-4-deoxy-L-arabinose transferase-like glycosyltransferase
MAPMTDVPAILTPIDARRRPALLAPIRVSTDALALAGLTALSGVLYLVNLTVSGYANTYYAMAAQAASQSWSALFFGALDSQGFITVDKPPVATALLGVSVRLFGLSSWSILLPQALLGVGTVLVLYLAVRRSFGVRAAIVAGVLMAITPVAVLMFRYDNPDAMLTFLLVCAAWALGRGLEHGRIRWAVLAATLIGLAFLTKYLQAWVVLPAFALTWLVSAPGSIRRRLAGLMAAGIAVAVSSLWWVVAVELIPAADRPYIGGSTTNSALELLLGYDGLGRIFSLGRGGAPPAGAPPGAVVGGPGVGFGGDPGIFRLFNAEFAGQIAWLLPAAILSILVGALIHRRTARTDRRLAGYVLWSSWLLVHAAVFSFMSGIIHPYYTVVIVPAIAALVGAAAVELWDRRAASRFAGLALAAGIVLSGATAWRVLELTPDFVPGLGIGILAVSVAVALVVAVPVELVRPVLVRGALLLMVVAALAGPLAYAIDTMQTAYAGGDPKAGPLAPGERGPGGPLGGDGVGAGGPSLSTSEAQADALLVAYLVANRGTARWVVAVDGSQVAAGIQLAGGLPVMTMGGFTGSDPAPTLDALKAYVASGQLRYVLVGGGPGGALPGPGPSQGGPDGINVGPRGEDDGRTAWVQSACAPVTIAGSSANLYDCAAAE